MNHKDLDVWKKSMDLVETIYKLTSNISRRKKFGSRVKCEGQLLNSI
jgi:hypothetical protein